MFKLTPRDTIEQIVQRARTSTPSQHAQEPAYGAPRLVHSQTPQQVKEPTMYAQNTQKQASYPGQSAGKNSARKNAMQNFLTKGATPL